MLRIRLQRTGRKNRPHYKIVVAEHTSPIKGKSLETVGFYDPLLKVSKIDKVRIDYWISQGAKASETVESLLKKDGKVVQGKRTRIGDRKKKKIEEEKAKIAEEKKAQEAPKEEAPVA